MNHVPLVHRRFRIELGRAGLPRRFMHLEDLTEHAEMWQDKTKTLYFAPLSDAFYM